MPPEPGSAVLLPPLDVHGVVPLASDTQGAQYGLNKEYT